MNRLIVLLCFLALPVLAQETARPDLQSPAEREGLRAQAQAMRERAKQLRGDAVMAHDAAQKICWEKFLVSDCLEQAKNNQREANREAKRLEVEAGRLERSVQSVERELRVKRRGEEKQAEIEKRRRENKPAD